MPLLVIYRTTKAGASWQIGTATSQDQAAEAIAYDRKWRTAAGITGDVYRVQPAPGWTRGPAPLADTPTSLEEIRERFPTWDGVLPRDLDKQEPPDPEKLRDNRGESLAAFLRRMKGRDTDG